MPNLDSKTGHLKFHVKEQRIFDDALTMASIVIKHSRDGSQLEASAIIVKTAIAKLKECLADQFKSDAPPPAADAATANEPELKAPEAKAPDTKPESKPDSKPAQSRPVNASKAAGAAAAATAILLALVLWPVAGQAQDAHSRVGHGPPAVQANIRPIGLRSSAPARSSDLRGIGDDSPGYSQQRPVVHAYIPTADYASCHRSRAQQIQDWYAIRQMSREARQPVRFDYERLAVLARQAAPVVVRLEEGLVWPAALQGAEFEFARASIEDAAYRRNTGEAQALIEKLEGELVAKVATIGPSKYVEARKFLLGLKRNT